MTEAEFSTLKRTVRRLIGIDLGAYKQQQMRRRLEAFVQRQAAGNVLMFCRAVERNGSLLQALADMLTINVTEFFRDPTVFERLREEVLPVLLQGTPRLKIWCAGCSKGPEVYTLAILLNDLSAARHTILATDIDRLALATARQTGPYAPSEVKNVSQELLRSYFTLRDGRYWFTGAVRQQIDFREHNLLADAYESGFDLILCRNVMIYFTPEARRAVTAKFLEALKPGGMLLLGSTEALVPPESAGLARVGPSLYRKEEPPNEGRLAAPKLSSRRAS